MAKTEMTLADEVMDWTYTHLKDKRVSKDIRDVVAPGVYQYRSWMKRANRFVLDDNFLAPLATMVNDLDRAAENTHMGRLPYPVVWVEYNQHRLFEIMDDLGALVTSIHSKEYIKGASPRAGFLIIRDPDKETRFTAFKFDIMAIHSDGKLATLAERMFMQDALSLEAQVDSVCISVDTEDPLNLRYGLFGTRSLTDFFGSLPGKAADAVDMVQQAVPLGLHPDDTEMHQKYSTVLRHYSYGIEPMMASMMTFSSKKFEKNIEGFIKYADSMMSTVAQSCRDLRGNGLLVTCLFAMINNVPTITKVVEPKGYRHMGMNKLPYMSHSVVTLQVPKVNPVTFIQRKISNALARTVRRHEVRGHWAHRHDVGRKDCKHAWFKTKDVNHEECSLCGAYRWWRTNYERGDAGKGFSMKQHYKVEAA